MPLVSVLMPAFNAEQFIGEAINSILNQTISDFEFVIVDDCSNDATVEIVKSYNDPRIRIIENKANIGIAKSLNRGLKYCNSKYIARMDADDISMSNRLERQISYLEKNPDVAVVGCNIEIFGIERGERNFSTDPEQLKIDLIFNNCFAHPTIMARKECLIQFGYNPEYSKMEDYDLWVRLSRQFKLSCIPETLLKYRMHVSQVTKQKSTEIDIQNYKIKERIIHELGIECDKETLSVFVDCCNGRMDTKSNGTIQTLLLCRKIIDNNKTKEIYDIRLLKKSIDSFIYGILDHYPKKQAFNICRIIQINPICYTSVRVIKNYRKQQIKKRKTKENTNKLATKDFTIISNNCWGGMIYQKYGLPYLSPTVGLFILGHDFVKLCKKWKEYFSLPLKFINWEDSRFYYCLRDQMPFPVAKLGDIEIYFMHYKTSEEAEEKWNRRVKRINPDKMIFKLSQREECSKEDIEEFLLLPLKNKVCFSYEKIPGVIYIPELKGLVGDETPVVSSSFDELTILQEL